MRREEDRTRKTRGEEGEGRGRGKKFAPTFQEPIHTFNDNSTQELIES
jgi:hypothetical protein